MEKSPTPALGKGGAVSDAMPSRKTLLPATRTRWVDTLLTQRIGTRQELNVATQKLAAARLGENLERGQHSERLEVLEQPTLPKTHKP